MGPGRGILVRWRVPVGDRGLPALAAPDPVLRVGHTRPGGLSRVGGSGAGTFFVQMLHTSGPSSPHRRRSGHASHWRLSTARRPEVGSVLPQHLRKNVPDLQAPASGGARVASGKAGPPDAPSRPPIPPSHRATPDTGPPTTWSRQAAQAPRASESPAAPSRPTAEPPATSSRPRYRAARVESAEPPGRLRYRAARPRSPTPLDPPPASEPRAA